MACTHQIFRNCKAYTGNPTILLYALGSSIHYVSTFNIFLDIFWAFFGHFWPLLPLQSNYVIYGWYLVKILNILESWRMCSWFNLHITQWSQKSFGGDGFELCVFSFGLGFVSGWLDFFSFWFCFFGFGFWFLSFWLCFLSLGFGSWNNFRGFQIFFVILIFFKLKKYSKLFLKLHHKITGIGKTRRYVCQYG